MNRNIKVVLIFAAVVAIVVAIPLLANQSHSKYNWEGGHMMGFTGWGWLMIPLMIVFWGLIIWAVIWAVGNYNRSEGSRNESAVEVLKRRYAAGEISREEFEAKRHDLS